jgi:hypothetical protein
LSKQTPTRKTTTIGKKNLPYFSTRKSWRVRKLFLRVFRIWLLKWCLQKSFIHQLEFE